ncbi:ABC-three component system protein [Yersinia wautersii]|uniref:ABC-three component system protein n=1 Tax=Yersinia wautersii TaxID=1341643 RepID=UPI00041DD329|nr:ABC-three component system protein [Yersinia wautersii]
MAVKEIVSFINPEEEAVIREDRTNAPELFTFDCGQLPFERMGDSQFELLVADVYRAEYESSAENWYDTVCRLNDGADQGRDVVMYKGGIPTGVIQCKRLKKNLDLGAVIYEICKFFLYAHIRPQIAPQLGTSFRYYFAVADGVTTDAFEFLQESGQKRFDDRLASFQEECGKILKKSKTLQKDARLKDLSPEQLREIVWQWTPLLDTKILKKDSLSSLVAKHSKIRNIYFKLDTDATEIIEVIKQCLASQGGVFSKVDEAYLQKIRTEYVNRELCEGAQLNIGLIQGSELIPYLKGMLAKGVGIFEQNFGNRPVVLTAGATAAISTQWSEINDLVKAYPYPLVFMVGCGEVSGTTLISWKKTDGMSWIDPSWHPASAPKFKAGWCWVTDPDNEIINCYVLVENEPKDAGFDRGNVSLRLAFKDVIVWPTLGNDFTNSIHRNNSQLRRVIASQAEDRLKRPNLVMASQHITELTEVVKSLLDYHARRLVSPIAVAAANSGCLRKCRMQLYSATGIFPSADSEYNTRSSPPAMQPPSRVMRRSTSGGLTLTLTWDTNLTLERAKGHRLQGGAVQDDLTPAALEFHELFDRYPPDSDYPETIKKEFAQLDNFVQSGGIKDVHDFAYQTIYGVTSAQEFTLEQLANSGKDVMKAVQALSYLKSHKDSTWITEPGIKGHLQFTDPNQGDYNVLAWANDEYRVRYMSNDLYRWARDTANHPQLVVFGNGVGRVRDEMPSKFSELSVSSSERFDITTGPNVKDSITDVAMVNKVYFFALNEIESMYDESDTVSAEDFMDDISTRRKNLDAQ